ncbi:MAG: galactokinase [Akkermansiaceae bacterium]|nr:galactokinase [Akkermansiaceae bacterium]
MIERKEDGAGDGADSEKAYADQKETVLREFEEYFGMIPFWLVASPSRVNLIGEHIDYCDGFVLPLAINRYVMIAVAPNGTSQANLVSTMFPNESAIVMLDEPPVAGVPAWANYFRGVLDGFRQKDFWPLPGFDALIHSTVPLGAGLSSSAALEVAAATVVEGMLGIDINPKNKALLCQTAEQRFAGVPCGIMDQFASVFAKKDHLVLIDCRSEEVQLIPFADDTVNVIIADTKVQHELSDGSYANRRKQTEIALSILGKQSWREVSIDDLESARGEMSEVVFRRARHVVTEIDRTQKAAMALARGKTDEVGELMAASHRSLRDDFEVSCRELDIMVEAAWSIGEEGGVLGSRMTGGGFGGSTVTLARADQANAVMEEMGRRYFEATGIEPHVFSTSAVDGVSLEEL